MKRKRLLVVLILFVIVAAGLFIFFSLRYGSDEETIRVEHYTEGEARKASQSALLSFELWRDPKVKEAYTLYDLNGNRSAYLFNVVDNYGKAGYVTVSANSKFDPVIETSRTESTPVTRTLKLSKQITQGTIYSQEDVRSNHLYLGDKRYFVEFEFREGDTVERLYYEVTDDQPQEISFDSVKQKQEYYDSYQEEGALKKWNTLLSQP